MKICKKKKIVIVTKSMFAGGAERVIAQLANYFVSIDIECVLITTDNERIGYELSDKVKLIAIGKKSNSKLVDRIERYRIIRNVVKKEIPTVVLSMPEDTGIYVILSMLGTGIPVYVSERNNPWVMPNVKITRLLRTLMYPFAKGIIFQTEMAQSFFSESIKKKSIILNNPVEEKRIPTQYEGVRKKEIVAAGRFDDQKNFQMLINAFSDFNIKDDKYKLIIYGEGNKRTELEKLVKDINLEEKILLPGRNNDLLNTIRESAMFILSSNYEGMPNVLIEAMCMGMPVISTDCPSGGPRQLIKDGINGLLIPVDNRKRMYDAMLIMTDEQSAKLMSNEAYKLRPEITNDNIFVLWSKFLFHQ